MRIYLDSNVLISLIKEEINSQLRALFIEAERFFRNAKAKGHTLVISEFFLMEVGKICKISRAQIIEYFEMMEVKTEIACLNEKIIREMAQRIRLHYPGNFHAAIALANKCDCIVTFNGRDFEAIKCKIQVLEPLDLA
ncbi:MAG: PIN domain-containing protein [Candidatus Diapherotrites archaeon]|nr:PIN domain-containing protein [Candidatus Diapherotrites archaeon]